MVYKAYYRKDPSFRVDVHLSITGVLDESKFAHVGTVITNTMEDAWCWFQAEKWSPNGEKRDLIRSLDLCHTSMSVGDVFESDDGKFWQVAGCGYLEVV